MNTQYKTYSQWLELKGTNPQEYYSPFSFYLGCKYERLNSLMKRYLKLEYESQEVVWLYFLLLSGKSKQDVFKQIDKDYRNNPSERVKVKQLINIALYKQSQSKEYINVWKK